MEWVRECFLFKCVVEFSSEVSGPGMCLFFALLFGGMEFELRTS
jgi:hypothetical protein